jgi:hypothetical protein
VSQDRYKVAVRITITGPKGESVTYDNDSRCVAADLALTVRSLAKLCGEDLAHHLATENTSPRAPQATQEARQ